MTWSIIWHPLFIVLLGLCNFTISILHCLSILFLTWLCVKGARFGVMCWLFNYTWCLFTFLIWPFERPQNQFRCVRTQMANKILIWSVIWSNINWRQQNLGDDWTACHPPLWFLLLVFSWCKGWRLPRRPTALQERFQKKKTLKWIYSKLLRLCAMFYMKWFEFMRLRKVQSSRPSGI